MSTRGALPCNEAVILKLHVRVTRGTSQATEIRAPSDQVSHSLWEWRLYTGKFLQALQAIAMCGLGRGGVVGEHWNKEMF